MTLILTSLTPTTCLLEPTNLDCSPPAIVDFREIAKKTTAWTKPVQNRITEVFAEYVLVTKCASEIMRQRCLHISCTTCRNQVVPKAWTLWRHRRQDERSADFLRDEKYPQATVGPDITRFMKIELEHRIPSPPTFAVGIGFAVLSGRAGGVRLDTEADPMRL